MKELFRRLMVVVIVVENVVLTLAGVLFVITGVVRMLAAVVDATIDPKLFRGGSLLVLWGIVVLALVLRNLVEAMRGTPEVEELAE